MTALRIAWKDIKFLLRSKTMLVFTILMPVLMMLMMGYIFPKDYNGKIEGKIGIYSQDPAFNIMMMLSKGKEHVKLFKNREELIDALAKNEVIAAAVVPKGFMKSLSKGNAEIEVIPNPSNPQAGIMMSHLITSMISSATNKKDVKKIKANLTGVYGGEFNYYDFMAPGMMAMIAIMSVSTGLAASITRERELGTLDGLMVAPINRSSIIIGKILAQTVRGITQALIVLVVAVVLFGVRIHGNILSTLLLLFLTTFSFIGIGIIITAGIKEQETAQIVMSTITFPMMFFSGVFFPIDQMPKFAQYISYIFPLTYAADALRKNITLGVGLSYMTFDIEMLILFSIVSSIAATLLFPKLVKD